MKKRKGSMYRFIAGSLGFFLLLNIVIISAPGIFESTTGVNTTSLQQSTNISGQGLNANQTSESNVVSQMGSLVNVYTQFESQNLLLSAIATLFIAVMIVVLVDLIWVG